MNIQSGLTGEYNLVVTRHDGSTTETGWFKNLILDQGLDRIGVSSSVINYCQIGTGTTVPAVYQVALTSYIAGCVSSGTTTVVNSGSPTYSSAHTIAYPFPQGAVVGNMAEIGVGWLVTGNNLFSRALITDISGNPTTITVTAIDQLTVYYKITFIPDVNIGAGSVVLAGVTYDYTSSIAYANSIYASTNLLIGGDFYSPYGGSWCCYISPAGTPLGAITTGLANETSLFPTPGLGPAQYCAGSIAPYISNTYYRDTTYSIGIVVGNFVGGIGAIRPVLCNEGGSGSSKYAFTPAIPKDDTKTFSMTFRTSWARA